MSDNLERRKSETKSEIAPQRDNKKILVEEAVRRVAERCPPWLKPIVEKSAPVINFLGTVLNAAYPLLKAGYEKACQLYILLKPYDPELLAAMLFGFVLMFFGGYFVTTIAAIEAFRITGWQMSQDSFRIIHENLKRVLAANVEDDSRDDDNDGIADVHQITPSQLVTRKSLLFLRSCNPDELSSALTGIYSGTVAAVAALKVQFARTIALGVAIGDILYKPISKVVLPLLLRIVPKEYHQWVPVVLKYLCKYLGCSIAWQIQRVLSSFHSALRGATLFCDMFAIWTAKRGLMWLSTGYWDEALAAVCSTVGVYFQIMTWFKLPTLLWLLLFPMVLLENFLQYFISFF